jgi:tripartite-type tricarboxylate transporter receptor subunit TctC
LCCAHHRDYHFTTGAEKAPQDRRRTRREEAMPTRSFARATRLAAVLALVAALCTPPAVAQQDASAGFPRQPLKLIVGFTAGGGTSDQFASKIARELPRWKQIAKDANIRLD